jgi:hypothetical protein
MKREEKTKPGSSSSFTVISKRDADSVLYAGSKVDETEWVIGRR